MSYEVRLPVTDMEHVMKEIKAKRWAESCISRTRRYNNLWQMEYKRRRRAQQ